MCYQSSWAIRPIELVKTKKSETRKSRNGSRIFFLSITYSKKTKNTKKKRNHNIDPLYRVGGSQRGAGNELRYELTLILNSYTDVYVSA